MPLSSMYNGNILDFEASGLEAEGFPIEVAVRLSPGRHYSALIKPSDDWTHWSKDAERVHGITREYLEQYGSEPRQVCEELNELCYGLNIFSDAWVKDSEWLLKLYQAAGMNPSFTLYPIEYFMPDNILQNWAYLKNISAKRSGMVMHRALNDVVIIGEVLDELADNNHIKSLDFKQTYGNVA